MAEIWKTIEDYPNYEVSSIGRVRNKKSMKLLSQSIDTNGYYKAEFRNEHGKKTITIHRLVAQHFVENVDNKKCVDHINRDRLNNNVENLRWVTSSENGMNTSIKSNNTSSCPGVCFAKREQKWLAQIRINKKQIHLGYFDDFDHAVTKRKQAEQQYY